MTPPRQRPSRPRRTAQVSPLQQWLGSSGFFVPGQRQADRRGETWRREKCCVGVRHAGSRRPGERARHLRGSAAVIARRVSSCPSSPPRRSSCCPTWTTPRRDDLAALLGERLGHFEGRPNSLPVWHRVARLRSEHVVHRTAAGGAAVVNGRPAVAVDVPGDGRLPREVVWEAQRNRARLIQADIDAAEVVGELALLGGRGDRDDDAGPEQQPCQTDLGREPPCPATCRTASISASSRRSVPPSEAANLPGSSRRYLRLSQVPSADQCLCRSYTVFRFPKRAGRSRQGTPVRFRYRIPLMTLRWLAQRTPRFAGLRQMLPPSGPFIVRDISPPHGHATSRPSDGRMIRRTGPSCRSGDSAEAAGSQERAGTARRPAAQTIR